MLTLAAQPRRAPGWATTPRTRWPIVLLLVLFRRHNQTTYKRRYSTLWDLNRAGIGDVVDSAQFNAGC